MIDYILGHANRDRIVDLISTTSLHKPVIPPNFNQANLIITHFSLGKEWGRFLSGERGGFSFFFINPKLAGGSIPPHTEYNIYMRIFDVFELETARDILSWIKEIRAIDFAKAKESFNVGEEFWKRYHDLPDVMLVDSETAASNKGFQHQKLKIAMVILEHRPILNLFYRYIKVQDLM